ncbi:MAG: DUF3187 family protein [Stenotrophobium sp.]
MNVCRALALACTALSTSVALADQPPPVEQGALVRGFALPSTGRPDILASGTTQTRLELDTSNEYYARTDPDEAIVVDGEVTRLASDFRIGLGKGWDAGVFVPLLIQGGGYLDSTIEGWHRFFSLPNAGRGDAPRNRYLYQYSRNGQTLLDAEQSSKGFGDIQINAGRRLGDSLALRGMVKLPTGRSSSLAGNGAWGGALWLDGRVPNTGDWSLLGSAGLSYTGTGDILPAQQEHWLPFASVALGYRVTERFTAQVQVYAHAAPYRDSATATLVHIGVPLTVSGSYRLSETKTVNFGFQEKANYGASPDFGIFLGLDLK